MHDRSSTCLNIYKQIFQEREDKNTDNAQALEGHAAYDCYLHQQIYIIDSRFGDTALQLRFLFEFLMHYLRYEAKKNLRAVRHIQIVVAGN